MSDIRIDSAFDSGNIEVLSIDGASAKLAIPLDDHSEFKQWFHFRVSGAEGRELELAAGRRRSRPLWRPLHVRRSQPSLLRDDQSAVLIILSMS